MDKMRRILVYVCKDGAAPQRAQFVQVSFIVCTKKELHFSFAVQCTMTVKIYLCISSCAAVRV